MPQLSSEDLASFQRAIDGALDRHWPQARTAGEDTENSKLLALWMHAAEQDWTDLASADLADAVLALLGRLGRRACPLPMMDVYIAATALAAHAGVVEDIRTARIRPVVARGEPDQQRVRFVEAARAATHVLVLSDSGDAVLRPIENVHRTTGLARPDWSDVTLGAPVVSNALGTAGADRVRSLLRLGLATRAVGAATRGLEFSLVHATERSAFGKPIGAFQAVSHRAVNGATDLTAARHLLDEAARSYAAQREDWQLAAALAVEFCAKTATAAQFGAQHTLAAMGYFEEHDAPWLFRRVHADIAKLDDAPLAVGEVADMLLEGLAPRSESLPHLELGEQAEAFRRELRSFLAPFTPDIAVPPLSDRGYEALWQAAAARGLVTMSWPKEQGGLGASVEEQIVLGEELAYRRLPSSAKTVADLLGLAIVRHGTPEQQQRFLPLLASGRFPFYLGYSEPEVGSDLAQLRTSAVRQGDAWIVNGRKMWGTGAHEAEWVWLAARTDPQARPPHAGITMFLTRIDRPGFESQRHIALSGEVSCSTFFDDYQVPDADRIGEINGGWKVITEALAQERVVMANVAASVHRLLDDALDELTLHPEIAGPRGSAKRRAISEFAARLQAARVLVAQSVRATARSGGGARLEAPMAKILASQLFEDFCEGALRLFGPAAALGVGNDDVPGRGAFEYGLRFSIMHVVGGGTIDIQRNLVARALGLPR